MTDKILEKIRDQLNIRTEDLPEEPEETGYALDHIHAFIPSRHV